METTNTMRPFDDFKIVKEQLRERLVRLLDIYRDTISGQLAPDLSVTFFMHHSGFDASYMMEAGWREHFTDKPLFVVKTDAAFERLERGVFLFFNGVAAS